MNEHPVELPELDLYDVWNGAPELEGPFDPFRFDHRMAAYRLLLRATNRTGVFGADNRSNPLWGLMFQHQWQFRTGRLGAGSQATGRIDPDAPWGYGNYLLCVVPWLGAVSAGVVPNLDLVGATSPSRFRYAVGGLSSPLDLPAELAPGVADWTGYFTAVRQAPPGADPEPIRMALWKAHKSCLDVATERLAGVDPAPYSAVELSFLQGWCRIVDYLWVAAWPTDFDFMLEHGLDVLPERLLGPEDEARGPVDLSDKVRSNVRNVIELAGTPRWRYDLNLFLWKRIMRTRGARRNVVALLDAIFNPSPANRPEQLRALRHLVRPW
jgi:hypothetical protein